MGNSLVGYRFGNMQFDVAIHSRTTLSDVEKLAYLRNSLKDGSAKGIIDGLSTSGEFYDETLKAR